MSKRNIVVEIDCEDERCGECDSVNRSEHTTSVGCLVHGYSFAKECRADPIRMKCCLAAEQKLRDLIEAGEEMREDSVEFFAHDCIQGYRPTQKAKAWEAALAAIKEE